MNNSTNTPKDEEKMLTFHQLAGFKKWFKSLKDLAAKEAILKRIEQAENGANFGDHKSVGGGVYENTDIYW
ncbi:putative addiction module killer protein [Cricetibacter osteomyelitidis]|uniref:Putative addiction module killer protein n=1 Tax=Cricetibacter osteomyelitidis TaxID=1521931 RepID=A0A4R2T0D8_9PAST|nr:putative addiction module killer protein [Cricetibacter osteomyelitidis]